MAVNLTAAPAPRSQVKRDKLAHYFNTGTVATPIWERIGAGISTGQVELNPETETVQDIDQPTGTEITTRFAPTMSIEFNRSKRGESKFNDAIFDAIHSRTTRFDFEMLTVYLDEDGQATNSALADRDRCHLNLTSGIGGDAGGYLNGAADIAFDDRVAVGSATYADLTVDTPAFVPNVAQAATGTSTISGTADTDGNLTLNLNGTAATVAVLTTDAAADIATKIVAAVTAATGAPVTATATGAVITFTAKIAGAAGNALVIEIATIVSIVATPITMAGGAD